MRVFQLINMAYIFWAGVCFSFLPIAVASERVWPGGAPIYIGLAALLGMIAVAGTVRLAPVVALLGREEYLAAIRTVVSPALAKSAELNELADELKARAVSAEKIVREVDELFTELTQATRDRQAELTSLLEKVEHGQSLNQLTEQQIGELRAILDGNSRARESRSLGINIGLAILGIVGGYALSLIYPAEEFRKSLLP